MILYSGDCVAVAIRPAFARRRSAEKLLVTRQALIMASTTRVPLERSTTSSAPEARASQAHTCCGSSYTPCSRYGKAWAWDRDRRHDRAYRSCGPLSDSLGANTVPGCRPRRRFLLGGVRAASSEAS